MLIQTSYGKLLIYNCLFKLKLNDFIHIAIIKIICQSEWKIEIYIY